MTDGRSAAKSQSIDNVGTCVPSLARSSCTRSWDSRSSARTIAVRTLAYGDTKLFLFEARTREDVQQRELGLLSNPPGLDHISFLGDDVDALYRRLVAEGTKTGGPPSDQDWGARLRLRDLNGKNLYFLRGL